MSTMATRLPTKFRLTTVELRAELAASKTSKYRNQPVTIDSIRFASKAEGKRYVDLKRLERAGEIRALKLQPRYDLRVLGEKVCTYVADFCYLDKADELHVEDVKGVQTAEFKIKAKLFRILYNHDIELIR